MALTEYADAVDALTGGAQNAPAPSPWAGAVRQTLGQQDVATRVVVDQAPRVPAEQAADAQRIADHYRVPSTVVAGHYGAFKEKYESDRAVETLKGAPAVAAWLHDGVNASIAHDDLDNLSLLDRVLGLGRNVIGAAGAGVMDFSRGVYGAVQAGAEVAGATNVADFARGSAEVAAHLAAKARGDQSRMGFIERNALGGLEGAAAMAPALMAGAVAGPAALIGAVGVTGLGQGYTEARAQGDSPARALGYGSLDAAIQVGTFYLPAHQLLGDLAAHAPLLTTLAHQAATAIPTMELQTALQDLNAWALLPANKDRPFSEYLRERPSAAAATLVNTIAFIGATTAVGHATAKLFDQVGQVASDSKSIQRAPGAVDSLVTAIAKDSPIETVYLPVESFTSYWQKQGVNPADAAERLLGDAKAYETAVRTGEDLAVPLGRYVTQIAPTEHNAFFANEVRLAPEQMNAREAQDFGKQLAEQASTASTTEETPANSAIHDKIVAQLEGAGVERSTAESYATVYEHAFGTLGARAGVDPVQLFEKYGLQITRPDLVDKAVTPAQNPESYLNVQRAETPHARTDAAAQEGARPADVAGEQPRADEGGNEQGRGNGDRAEPRRLPAPAEPGEVFTRQPQADTAARLSEPRVREALDWIREELLNNQFTKRTWNWLTGPKTGNAAGGAADIVAGHAGAEVYHDIVSFSPVNKHKGAPAKAVRATRTEVVEAINALLKNEDVHNNVAEGALRVAENRAADNYADLSAPELPPPFGTEVPRELTDALSVAIDSALSDSTDVGGDTSFNVDTFDTGEQQSRLPGDVGAVREQNVTTPEFEAPFSLISEAEKSTGKQTKLYQEAFDQKLETQIADAEDRLRGLDVKGALEGSRRVPFPAIDARTADTLYQAADRSQEHRVTVPIDKLVATQDTISEPIARGKLTGEQAAPRALEYAGRYFLGDGTHTAAAAWARGDKTIDVLASPVDPARVGQIVLHQKERGVIKFGADRQFNIELLKGADLSTFLHESGHLFLEVMRDLEAQSPRIKADLDVIRAEFGTENVAQHEGFAKSFEKYLMEGKAPSAELRPVFARFRAWLVGVYRSVRGLGVELTPEVRGVFDRLLASDQAIEQARTEADIRPLFTDAKSAGMSDSEFEKYRSVVADASEKTREALQTKIMRDVQREQTAQWKAERETIRTQVASDVGEQPVYRALTAIRKGLKPDGTPLVEGREPEPLRLAKADLSSYGPDVLKTLRRLDAYRVEGGVSPDVVAELTGYSSGDELVKALAGAEPMNAAIERETTARMTAKHGDMLIDGTLATKAEEAVNGEHRQTVVRAELKALTSGMVKGTIPPAAVINHAAETRIASTKVRDLRPGQFLMAAKRASQKAFDLLATNEDRAGAVQAKQQELVNLALYREATKAQDAVTATVEHLRSFDNASTRERIGKAGAGYLEQIDGIRDRFDLSTTTLKALDRRAALAKWAASEEAATGLPLNLPDELLNEARRVNYKDLPVEELQGVRDGVRMIEHLAILKNKLLKAQGSRDLAASVAEAVTSIAEHSKGPRQTGIEVRLPGSSTTRNIGTFFASHVKLSSFIREMDGFKDGGAMWDRVLRPLNEAADAEAVRNEQATVALHGIFADAYKGEETSLYHKTFIPAINGSLSKMARLMVALNAGNDGNRQRLRDGYHWTDDQVRAITDTLDARDVKFVNDVIGHINAYWPDIEAKERRVTGVAPEKVDAVPFSGAGGQFDGGYFPLKYEHELSARTSANLEGSFAEGVKQAAYARATTQRGHTEARLEKVSEPVRLDFGVITEHVQQVIHDLTHHETLLDVSRILAHKDVQDAIYQHYGAETYDQIKGAVRDIAFGNTPSPGWYKTLNSIRAKTVTATLGWNAITSLLHTLQISRGMARVDPVSVLKGLGRWAVSAKNAENSVGWIESQSDMMRLRWKTQQRELNEVRNQVGLDRGKVSAAMHDLLAKAGVDPGSMPAIADSYFYAIRRIVQFAEIPTWLGAYDKGMTESSGDNARAVALANQAVIDSMGSGQIKDLAAVQRSQNARVFTTFYDYHNAVYQQVRELVKKDASYGRKFVDASLMLFVPVALGVGLHSLTAKKDDKSSVLGKFAQAGLDYGLGMWAGTRDLEGAFTRADWSGPAGLRFIPTARNFLFQSGAAVGKVTRGESLTEPGQRGGPSTAMHLLRATNEAGGALFGYPANQVDRTVRGLHAVMDGKADLSAVVFGPPKGVQ